LPYLPQFLCYNYDSRLFVKIFKAKKPKKIVSLAVLLQLFKDFLAEKWTKKQKPSFVCRTAGTI
jgi:hypothetical protein